MRITITKITICFALYRPLHPQGNYNDECKFKEKILANNYNAYESAAYPGMYIGLSKTGKTKRGNRVTSTMTMTHFLPRIWIKRSILSIKQKLGHFFDQMLDHFRPDKTLLQYFLFIYKFTSAVGNVCMNCHYWLDNSNVGVNACPALDISTCQYRGSTLCAYVLTHSLWRGGKFRCASDFHHQSAKTPFHVVLSSPITLVQTMI